MSNRRILVMDEEFWSIQPAIDRIERVFGSGITEWCDSGLAGLTQLQDTKQNYCCVILDIMFPLGRDTDEDSISGGLIILNEIRNILHQDIPVICFTFRDDESVKTEINKFTRTTHISKLTGLEQLINQIKKHVK